MKPEGFIFLENPCMDEKPVMNSLLKIGYPIGIMPKINPFTLSEIKKFFISENFGFIETDRLKRNSYQYLIIAKKII